MNATVQPIIIKKKKVVSGGGHHGGAWKVAYADFVTAMMAFFLLMWLLNATTEEQRKGIADYFSPTIPIASVSGGGPDALSGDSVYTTRAYPQSGTGGTSDDDSKVSNARDDTIDDTIKEQIKAQQMQTLNQAIQTSKAGLSEHVMVKMSPEGLVIELVDREDNPLFDLGSARPSPLLQSLMSVVTEAFDGIQNNVKIVGHTDNLGFAGNGRYSNWDLSTDRANTARRLMVLSGFPPNQITEVAGKAYTDPVSNDPSAAKNRRISITILE